jgi:eukaryotic-like serine/threonine-protein kinase
MPQLLSCPGGHHWQSSNSSTHCPVCGAANLAAATPPFTTQSDTVDLPAPPSPNPPPSDATQAILPHAPVGKSADVHDQTMTPTPPKSDGDHTLAIHDSHGRAAPAAEPSSDALTENGTAMFVTGRAGATEGAARQGDLIATMDYGSRADQTERPGTSADRAPRETPLPGGPTVPGYKVVGVLGRGAMGVVYKARQVGLNRLVALKMILSGAHASEKDLARFRIEAEAVAKLDHPCIVQVYEINDVDGRPYFCLEFVDGGPLDKKLRGNPQPFREAAELVRKLAGAMEYAHQRHIVHRDLKPPNILLTSDGVPKITDFGLAKNLGEESSQTQSGSIMGTPSYMAPEQAQGRTHDVGPAADIYALGAILYETLVGRPPFKGESILDTLEQVSTQQPVPPSKLRPRVPRDLETICLKCLHKERDKRYARAGDLAEDLRRFTAGEPILARPTPAWECGVKWVRRHPVPAALAAVSALFVLSLIVGGAAFGIYQQNQAEEQGRLRGLAVNAKEASDANFQRAETNYGRARSAVDQMLTEVGQERLAREPRMEKLRRELLTRALDFYTQFLEEKSNDPGVRWETARACLRVGDIQEMLGEHETSEKSYLSARSFFTELRTESPNEARYQQDLAVCLNNLGQLFKDAGRTPEAEQSLRDALELRRKLVDESGRMDDRRELAAVGGNLGVLLLGFGQFTEGESLLLQSLQVREELAGASTDPAARLELARGQNNLGVLQAAIGRGDEAEQTLRKARDVLQRLQREYPGAPDYRQELAVGYNHLGNLWRDTQPKKSEEAYRDSLKWRHQLAIDFPTVPVYRQEQAASYHSLGFVLQAAGRHDDADEAYSQALGIQEKLVADYPKVPDYPYELAGSYNNRGVLLHTSNRLTEAEKLYDKARTLLEKLVAAHPDAPAYRRELADSLQNLGVLYQTTNRPDDAAKSMNRSLEVRRRLAAAYPTAPVYEQDLASAQLNLGVSWQMNHKLPESETFYREAIKSLTAMAARYPGVPDYRHLLAGASTNLGNLLRDAKRPQEAEAAWKQAADLLKALNEEQPTVPAYRQELTRGLNEMGIFLASENRGAEAEKVWGRVMPLQEQLAADFPKNPVYREELAKYESNRGVLFAHADRLNQAEKSYRRAVELLEELEKADPDSPVYLQDLIAPYGNLVSLLKAVGTNSDETETCWRHLAALKEKLADACPNVPSLQGDAAATAGGLAQWLRERRKPADARDFLRKAIGRDQAALKREPQNSAVRQSLSSHYLALAQILLDLNDHAAAADTVAQLVKAAPADWSEQHLAAACLARAASQAGPDERLAGKYSGEAMDLLRQGAASGFKDADFLARTNEFASLRSRDDFKALTAELEKK